MIDRFREEVYQSFDRRADVALDFIDALASERHTESPVAVSESSLFRRGFSSVYELLGKPFINEQRIRQILNEFQPPDAEGQKGEIGAEIAQNRLNQPVLLLFQLLKCELSRSCVMAFTLCPSLGTTH